MTQKLSFYIVDVFAEEKYAGNQLAVIRSAGKLSDGEMQKVAKEMHFSETSFIISEAMCKGGYDVRIFTPEKEIPFAGHPTLGTAYVIRREIIRKPTSSVILNLKVGQIPVAFSESERLPNLLWMKQIKPTFGQILDASAASRVLSLNTNDLDSRFPVEEVSTGTPFIIVPLLNLSALKRARIKETEYYRLIENIDAKAVLIFCPETRHKENDLSVRVFADYFGVSEDPATGSANGCLAGYLVKHRYFGKTIIDVRVEQGYEIGRQSLLLLKAKDKNGVIEIFVGGKVIMVAEGHLA